MLAHLWLLPHSALLHKARVQGLSRAARLTEHMKTFWIFTPPYSASYLVVDQRVPYEPTAELVPSHLGSHLHVHGCSREGWQIQLHAVLTLALVCSAGHVRVRHGASGVEHRGVPQLAGVPQPR